MYFYAFNGSLRKIKCECCSDFARHQLRPFVLSQYAYEHGNKNNQRKNVKVNTVRMHFIRIAHIRKGMMAIKAKQRVDACVITPDETWCVFKYAYSDENPPTILKRPHNYQNINSMNIVRVCLRRIHYSQMYQVSIIAARRRLHKIDGVHLG